MLMRLVNLAQYGAATLVVPALAVLEAQVAISANPTVWDHVLTFPGVRDMSLTAHAAVAVGDLAGPRLRRYPLHTELMAEQMTAQVVHEAVQMTAIVATRIPTLYRDYPVVLMEL
ncbi:hypothetical protein ADL15_40750 [Actinoplanes awajinensis subsp. mycoplanecinus]|uniref:Uncharacterized protein n=2 Tax=Actinoplanes awajinensis TaxID=135946 RepID=A0A101JEK9_9ACTN|nr:hypothetical protein ADL15_40750 [Actinoplanes awajinensis subsp. mycoplanecinus]